MKWTHLTQDVIKGVTDMLCVCNECGMAVKGLLCNKCETELVSEMIQTKSGERIQVATCPNGCGMIKSPTCCGKDMVCTAH